MIWSALVLAAVLLLLEAIIRLTWDFSVFKREPAAGGERVTYTFNEVRPSFAMPKPPGIYRVFFFGESACLGTPFAPGGGFPEWLQAEVNLTAPGKRLEAVNLAVNSINSRQILLLFRESLEYQPDLIVLYIGNNDMVGNRLASRHPNFARSLYWLSENTAIFRAISGVLWLNQANLNAVLFHPKVLALDGQPDSSEMSNSSTQATEIDKIYAKNIGQMTSMAAARNIPVVTVAPASNLRDWPPLKSIHQTGVSLVPSGDAERAEGERALAVGDLAWAQSLFERALMQDPAYARYHFLLAQTLERLGQPQAAFGHYQLARDLDVIAIRAPRRFDRILRQAGASGFIDLDRELFNLEGRPPGFDYFMDGVHFTPGGNYAVAVALARSLSRLGFIKLGPQPLPSIEKARASMNFPETLELFGYHGSGIFLGFTFNDPARIRKGVDYLHKSRKLWQNDSFPDLACALLLARLGDWRSAGDELARALSRDTPGTVRRTQCCFQGIIEIYQSQVVMRIPSNDKLPQFLRCVFNRQKAGDCDGGNPAFGPTPLAEADHVWLIEGGGLRDLSAGLPDLKQSIAALPPQPEQDVTASMIGKGTEQVGEAKYLSPMGRGRFLIEAQGVEPRVAVMIIEARLTADQTTAKNQAILRWTRHADRQPHPENIIAVPFPADGKWHRVVLPMHQSLRLIMPKMSPQSFNLQMLNASGTIEIKKVLFRDARRDE